ncbi:MAG: hypothetical protein EOO92_12660 [Pedobacter sp.]|nr:MAG: hypothetical protein EOO92_12660 [Pedobacter sp.]
MNRILIIACCLFSLNMNAQTKKVTLIKNDADKKVDVLIDEKPFTSFIFPDNLEKPVLYPINAASGTFLTRGFPLKSRDGERTDHPHHLGYWLNYESVNGLDFWNNSYAIPAERKSKYGWIRNVKVTEAKSGKAAGTLTYTANWENQAKNVLLIETTTFTFSGEANSRTIDRVTTLVAQKDTVKFKDIKDGMVGLRLTKELEFPSNKVEEFTDAQGNITKVPASGNGASGDYLTSEGKTGVGVWATRGTWCLLKGTKEGQPLSVAIIDHPKNAGYPTYWHARDYGLFAANPLGQDVFSNGKEKLNLTLKPGEKVTFRYRMVITSNEEINADKLNSIANNFAKK